MAASIYATPPPDLSNEDTALSDVSNTAAATTTNTTTTNNNASTTLKAQHSTTTTTTTSPAAATSSSSLAAVAATLTNNNKINSGSSSNSSGGNSSHNQLREQHSIADASLKNPKPPTSTTTQCSSNQPSFVGNPTSNVTDNEDSINANDNNEQHTTTTTTTAATATAMAAMQLQLLEAINDAAKKRRKQHNPSRMEDEEEQDEESDSPRDPSIDYEDKLSKMLLPKSMEQLKETFEYLQQQQQQHHHQQQQQQHLENISKTQELNKSKQEDQQKQHQQQQQQQLEQSFNNPYHTYCKECGENFENEFKLSLHMLQEHNDSCETFSQNQPTIGDMSALDILASVKVKLERPECESPSSNHTVEQAGYTNDRVLQNTGSSTGLTNGKGQQQHNQTQQSQQQPPWLAGGGMPPMGFPFPPEAAAAAALQAGGYLPLLAVPGFPGVDGLSRPPLRIFNPEAFCELCNKEFCNKYFLKTHKANKHGIYDPSTDGLSGQQQQQQQQQQSNMNAMNQMFQMQMQHQQQMQLELAQQQQKLLINEQQQQQSKGHETQTSISTTTATITSGTNKTSQTSVNSQANTPPAAPQPVFCDICSKRFTNVFAMRRHRAKLHEQSPNNTSQRNSPSESSNSSSAMESNVSTTNNDVPAFKQFQMPEGFRQDYVLEQEEVSFTPQPRKLSPQSQQQAREANFSHDKLKRLGVLNPDAFCEICCKEYCNKYFLRTHKWKRHGIFMPPEESENLQKLPTWPFMNMPGMPVNLMMAQRMMTASQEMPTEELQPSKRIKLEKPDEDELARESNQDENQENRSENNQASSPELNKLINDHQHSETSMGLQNLQKLQTMIQQLNDLNGKRPVNCHLCGRELENQYALQAHIMAEHAGAMEGSMAPLNFPSHLLMHQQALLKQSPNGSPTSLMPLMGMPGTGELRCNPCDREFNSLPEFQKHIADVHLLTSSSGSPLREGFLTPERPINTPLGQAARPPYTITPTSSYCEICNKELCNKYFMKTHMQRMHGIEIENGAQIGGVVCNICNKELCSKYFLRVHKHNTHGIIEDGAPLPQPRQNGLNLDSALQQQMMETDAMNRNLNMSPFGSAGSEGKAEAYTPPSSYSEACSLCSRRFRNSKWLRSHLLSDHGATGLEKVREMDQQFGATSLSKPSSPTLKIPNGASSSGSASATPSAVPSPAQLAQALQNLNAQHLIKNNMTTGGSFTSEQNLQSPQLKEYQCSTCPFTTPYYAFLFIHERTHSILNNNEQEQENEMEQEQEQELEQGQELQTVEQEKNEQKPKIVEEETERKVAKRKTNREAKTTSLEVIKLDQDDYVENMDEKFLMSNETETEPTNLSMRTPSPTEITSTTTSRGELENKTNSPKANVATVDIGRSLSVSPQQGLTTSTAQSPVFNNHMPSQQQQQHRQLQEMAQQTGKIATFAMPRLAKNDATNETPQMQAFVMEAADEQSEEADRFVPAIVYLPVRERLTGTTMKLSFKLTPV